MLRMPRRAPREGLAIIATPFTSSCKASVFGIICGLVADKKWKPHPHSEGRLVARGRMFVFLGVYGLQKLVQIFVLLAIVFLPRRLLHPCSTMS